MAKPDKSVELHVKILLMAIYLKYKYDRYLYYHNFPGIINPSTSTLHLHLEAWHGGLHVLVSMCFTRVLFALNAGKLCTYIVIYFPEFFQIAPVANQTFKVVFVQGLAGCPAINCNIVFT